MRVGKPAAAICGTQLAGPVSGACNRRWALAWIAAQACNLVVRASVVAGSGIQQPYAVFRGTLMAKFVINTNLVCEMNL